MYFHKKCNGSALALQRAFERHFSCSRVIECLSFCKDGIPVYSLKGRERDNIRWGFCGLFVDSLCDSWAQTSLKSLFSVLLPSPGGAPWCWMELGSGNTREPLAGYNRQDRNPSLQQPAHAEHGIGRTNLCLESNRGRRNKSQIISISIFKKHSEGLLLWGRASQDKHFISGQITSHNGYKY